MKRKALANLVKWQLNPCRKPLILKGMGQVGKTWLLKEFGNQCFENTVYLNFSNHAELQSLFSSCSDPQSIINRLSDLNNCPIIPGKTLIIFDEIQENIQALISLSYFNDEVPQYAIVCTGSIQNLPTLDSSLLPSEKFDILSINPLTFIEFLEAEGLSYLADYLYHLDRIGPIPLGLFKLLLEKLMLYLQIGGMPTAIQQWINCCNLASVADIQEAILKTYELDCLKHIQTCDQAKFKLILSSIPRQLIKHNIKFFFSDIRAGARAREYLDILSQLQNLGMIYKVQCTMNPSLTLAAGKNSSSFELYLPDIGLFRASCGTNSLNPSENKLIAMNFEHALLKNYVLQELITTSIPLPRYWLSGLTAKVDFIIQWQDKILPVEINPTVNLRAKRLQIYRNKYCPPVCLRFSFENLSFDGQILNIPLFLAGRTDELLKLIF